METVDAMNENLRLDNGILNYLENPFNGLLITHFPNGKLASKIQYLKGRKQGFEKHWYEGGTLAIERWYTNGIKTGIHRAWWVDAVPKFKYHFNEVGAYNGSVKEWDASGQLYKEFNYVNGYESGSQRLFKPNGKIKANYEVVNGERFGLIGLKKCKTVTVNSTAVK